MTNPYTAKGAKSFWRSAVAEKNFLQISQLWYPKFSFSRTAKIVTSGSCFAQHIGNALRQSGFNWYDAEPAPKNTSKIAPVPDNLAAATARDYGYQVFSFRTGNIYTTSLLRQWVNWATGAESVPDEVWEASGRYYDPFRPAIEPGGFGSAEEVRVSRQGTVEAVGRAIRECAVFVFTLGLTERWLNTRTGIEYPMCPGTAAGEFDAGLHAFDNMSYIAVHKALLDAIRKIRRVNPGCRFLLTVSPVPLTATATDNHVLVATTYSKSTLRAVAGDLAQALDFVDYFPSYEIISSPPFRASFFNPNLRTVASEGVAHVMSKFFEEFEPKPGPEPDDEADAPPQTAAPGDVLELACEEELLEVFGAFPAREGAH